MFIAGLVIVFKEQHEIYLIPIHWNNYQLHGIINTWMDLELDMIAEHNPMISTNFS